MHTILSWFSISNSLRMPYLSLSVSNVILRSHLQSRLHPDKQTLLQKLISLVRVCVVSPDSHSHCILQECTLKPLHADQGHKRPQGSMWACCCFPCGLSSADPKLQRHTWRWCEQHTITQWVKSDFRQSDFWRWSTASRPFKDTCFEVVRLHRA